MEEWSRGRQRLVGVAVAPVLVYLAYLGGRWLWGLVLEMHHM